MYAHLDESRQGENMLNYPRDKIECVRRSGKGGGVPAV